MDLYPQAHAQAGAGGHSNMSIVYLQALDQITIQRREFPTSHGVTTLGVALMKWTCAASIRLDVAMPPTWQMSPAASHTRAAARLFCSPPNLRSLMLTAFAPFAAAT